MGAVISTKLAEVVTGKKAGDIGVGVKVDVAAVAQRTQVTPQVSVGVIAQRTRHSGLHFAACALSAASWASQVAMAAIIG